MWNSSRAFALVAFAACTAPTAAPGPDSGSNTNPGNGTSSPQAPKILSLHSNAATVDEKQSLVISAVVTDPDGIDDLIGGNLTTVDGNSAYGAFSTDANEGAYSITLSWATIDATSAIVTDPGQSTSRKFRAVFFDAEGNSTYQDVTVGLRCSSPTLGACDGTCKAFATEASCGSCDHACPMPDGSRCQMSASGSHMCLDAPMTTDRVACSSVCRAPYGVCLGGTAVYFSGSLPVACGAVPPASNGSQPFGELTCACADQ